MFPLRSCAYSLALVFCSLVFACFGGAASSQEKRVALIIGNSDYAFVSPLPNPTNDATDVAASLKRLGFSVTLGTNLDYNQMRLMVRDFGETATDADIVLVYFAGHGIEIDNTNYLIPVNAQLKSDRDVEFEAIRLDAVMGAIDGSQGVKIVLVDACRNNPFVADMARTTATRSIGRGLARIDPGGVLVGYSARGGTTSLDGDGRNSPYALAVLKYIGEPGLELGKMFRKVRDSVLETTGGDQEPFTYGSLPGDDIFLVPPVETASAQGPQAATAPSSGPTIDALIIDDFATAQASQTLDAWSTFLEKYAAYPENSLVKIAAANRAALKGTQDEQTRMAKRKPWLSAKPAADGRSVILTADERVLVQKSLTYMGFDVGAADGNFGAKTLRAISAARFKTGLPPGNQVDMALLTALPDVQAIEALRSDKARYYDSQDLPDTVDPRLSKAIKSLGHVRLMFDYFGGRIYIAVLQIANWHDNWSTASLAARNAGGHLATISSAAENEFIYRLFSSDPDFSYTDTSGYSSGPMIGLYQAPGSAEPSGGWAWETGEPVAFLGWSPGNPDNFGGRQNFARYFRKPGGTAAGAPIKYWDDTNSDLGSVGYIIEIE